MAGPTPPNHSRPTFLFTDIVDSSVMSKVLGPTAYGELLQGPHDAVLEAAAAAYGGYLDNPTGDSYLVVFAKAEQALECAREVQKRLCEAPLMAVDVNGVTHTLAVRIGMHTAEREAGTDPKAGYRSHPDVNFAARVQSLAGAEQILVSAETHRRAANAAACKWLEWPARWIKSFEEAPETLYEFLWDGGESKGEPGLRWLPATFRSEFDRYIQRPELQENILSQYRKPKAGGVQARLVTLAGYGGMGKTRLGVACALQSVGLFPDGVYFVPLAERPAAALSVIEGISTAIKESKFAELDTLLPENPSKLEDLLPALRAKSVLLVLDNYESVHCDEVQGFLRALLRETRHLRLLVTSREAAHLHPLEKEVAVEGLTADQAAELFIDRAQKQRHRAPWTPAAGKEQAALARILELTERIPLALELLAAWMGLREIGEIAVELEKTPLPALPKGHFHSDPSERHQSLEKSLTYSYRMLDPNLQRGLALLSLFADSFDAEGAAGACGLREAQDVLDRLYEKSWLMREADEGRSRCTMLRPTRAYAAARLEALHGAADAKARYVTHYRQLAITNDDVNDRQKLAVLEREWRNALAAADYAEGAGDSGGMSRLSEHLGDFLLLRGWWAELERLTRRAFETARRAGDDRAEGRTLNNLGLVYEAQGRWLEAIDCYERSLGVSREHGDRRGEGLTLNNLGIVYQEQGQGAEALDCYQRSLAIKQECGDRVGEGQTLNNLGGVYRAQDRWAEALDCYERSLVILREFGDRVGEGTTRIGLGLVYAAQGQWPEAIDSYKRSLVIKREYGDRVGEGQTLNNLGIVYQEQGRWPDAIDCYEKNIAICREYGDRLWEGKTLENVALLHLAQGDIAKALEWERQALARLETTEDRRAIEKARGLIAKWEQQ